MQTQSLSDHMSFDHVIRVHPNGAITDGPPGVHAPDLYDDELSGDDAWSLLDGFSGQWHYSGPMMHQSEFIGGGLERHIRETPGLYVALVNYPLDDTEELTEWAVACQEWHNDYPHEPGYLYDCQACEARCHCTPGHAECVFSGEHTGGES